MDRRVVDYDSHFPSSEINRLELVRKNRKCRKHVYANGRRRDGKRQIVQTLAQNAKSDSGAPLSLLSFQLIPVNGQLEKPPGYKRASSVFRQLLTFPTLDRPFDKCTARRTHKRNLKLGTQFRPFKQGDFNTQTRMLRTKIFEGECVRLNL